MGNSGFSLTEPETNLSHAIFIHNKKSMKRYEALRKKIKAHQELTKDDPYWIKKYAEGRHLGNC